MGLSVQSADCMVRSLQTAWSPCRLKTAQKLAILFDNGYYSFSCLYLGETMTSLFARNERLLWRTRFSTTEMPSQFLTQYNTIKSWQFSLFSLKLSLQSTHVHVVRVKQVNLYDIRAKQASRYNVVHAIETVAAQSADCMACSLQTARGFQIAWNIDNVRFQMQTPQHNTWTQVEVWKTSPSSLFPLPCATQLMIS